MLERIVGVAGGEHEQLGIEPLERFLEFSSRPTRTTTSTESRRLADILVAGGHDPRVAGKNRQQSGSAGSRSANRIDGVVGRGPPRRRPRPAAPPRHRLRRRSARSVALGDGLAQTSGAGHASQHYRSWLRFSGALAPGVGLLAALPPSPPPPRLIVGTARADFLAGRDGSDRIVARAGNDRISAEYDGAVDRISCGTGRDIVTVDARDVVQSDCEVVSTRIHRRQSNAESQHETQVEPDSHTVGATTVALFQNGRNRTGGAASVAFSTSKDGGSTWREGILPGLTTTSVPPGTASRERSGGRVRQPARRLAGQRSPSLPTRRGSFTAPATACSGQGRSTQPARRHSTSPSTRTG